MSGQGAIRGFWIQTLIALLESFNDSDWLTVTVEPNYDNTEKVDIEWTYQNKPARLVQVKSTKSKFNLKSVKETIEELQEQNVESDIELLLVGNATDELDTFVNNNRSKNIKIVQPYNKELYNDILRAKFEDSFLSNEKIFFGSQLKKLLINHLAVDVLESSIIGAELTREELKRKIVKVALELKKDFAENGHRALFSDGIVGDEIEEKSLTECILTLIGWEGYQFDYNNPNLDDEETYIKFYLSQDSCLHDHTYDNLMIQNLEELEYTKNIQKEFKKLLQATNDTYPYLKLKSDNNYHYDNHSINFILSDNIEEYDQSVLNYLKTSYGNHSIKKENLIEDLIYYTFDNQNFMFLVSSIMIAREYRPELTVKYLYPQTDKNINEKNVGRREARLPPQYINSSIIPIIKETTDYISILLYCRDSYSSDVIRKLIWFIVRLTNGCANEYRIYLPDYEKSRHRNEVIEIVKTFGNKLLSSRLSVHKLNLVDPSQNNIFRNLDLSKNKLIDNEVSLEQLQQNGIQINNQFLKDYLPFGNDLKLFLQSKNVSSSSLTAFLETKGIFIKSKDKKKLASIMSTMLFSPKELHRLINFVVEKKPILKDVTKEYDIINNVDTQDFIKILQTIRNNLDVQGFSEQTDIEIRNDESKINSDKNGYEFSFDLQSIDPDEHTLIQNTPSLAKLSVVLNDKEIKLIKFYSDKNSRLFINRIEKEVETNLLKNKLISKIIDELSFYDFDSNEQRVDFLLSFTDIRNSSIFKSVKILSVDYAYDEKLADESYNDKKDKEFNGTFNGNNIEKIKELSDKKMKEIILIYKIKVQYDYEYKKVKNSAIKNSMTVVIEFSNNFKSKSQPKRVLEYSPKLNALNSHQKQKIVNIDKFSDEIRGHFTKLRDEKVKNLKRIWKQNK